MSQLVTVNKLYRHPRYGVVRVKDIKGESTFVEYAIFNGDNRTKANTSFTSVSYKQLVPHDTVVGKTLYDINSLRSVEVLNEAGNNILVKDKQDKTYTVAFWNLRSSYRECLEANLRNIQRNENIVKHLKKGDSLPDIAVRFAVDKTIIQTIARSYGLELNNPSLSKEVKEKVRLAKISALTLSYDDIKSKYNLTDDIMIISGIKDKVEKQKESNKILGMYKENYTLKEIADFFGCSMDRISRLIRLNNAYKFPLLKMSIEDRKKFTENIKSIIIEKYNAGLSDDDIIFELNEEGHKTLFGGEFTISHIKKVIREITQVEVKPIKKEIKELSYLDTYLKSKNKKKKI